MYFQTDEITHQRIREQHLTAADHRLAGELAAARRWQRISTYCARRAVQSRRRAERSTQSS
jgi:hypothetical protein